jgi:hypothetical protein
MPKKFKVTSSKLPVNLHISQRLPYLFSFPPHVALLGLIKEISLTFNKSVSYLNDVAITGASLICGDDATKTEYDYLEILINNKAVIEDPSNQPKDWILYARVITAIMMLQRNTLNLNLDYLNYYLQILLNMPNQYQNDEICWYIVCLVYFRVLKKADGNCSREDLTIWLQMLQKIKSPKHRDGTYSLILLFTKHNNLITLPIAYQLDNIYQNRGYSHKAIAIRAKHNFVKLNLYNQRYFDYENALPLANNVHLLDLYVDFSSGGQYRIALTKLLLLKVAAHLYPISGPIFSLHFPTLCQYDNEQITLDIIGKFRALKFCDSSGLLKSVFFNKDKNGNFANKAKIRQIIFDCIYARVGSRRVYWQEQVDLWDMNSYEAQYVAKLKFRDFLEGLVPDQAMLMLRQCIDYETPHGVSVRLRQTIMATLLKATEIFSESETIEAKQITNIKKHEQWFQLAKKVVAQFLKDKNTMILYAGVPRETVPSGEEPAHHAMYVVLTYQLNGGKFQIRIIIVNGGYGSNFFHRSATHGIEDDNEERDFAACQPFELSLANREILEHYVYNVISLKHRYTSTKYQESPGDGHDRSQNTFEDVMRDIYLRSKNDNEREYFRGFQYKEFNLSREDLTTGCINQFMGNCTIHNLKKAIQIGYSLDEENYGRLEDQLLIGFDRFVEKNPVLKL